MKIGRSGQISVVLVAVFSHLAVLVFSASAQEDLIFQQIGSGITIDSSIGEALLSPLPGLGPSVISTGWQDANEESAPKKDRSGSEQMSAANNSYAEVDVQTIDVGPPSPSLTPEQ